MAEKKIEGLFWTESRTEARKLFKEKHGDPRKYAEELTDNFLRMLDQEAVLAEPYASALKNLIADRLKYLDPLERGRAEDWSHDLLRQLKDDVINLMTSGKCSSMEKAYTLLKEEEPYKSLKLKPNKQTWKRVIKLYPEIEKILKE